MWIDCDHNGFINTNHCLQIQLFPSKEEATLFPLIKGKYEGVAFPIDVRKPGQYARICGVLMESGWILASQNQYINLDRFAHVDVHPGGEVVTLHVSDSIVAQYVSEDRSVNPFEFDGALASKIIEAMRKRVSTNE